jgi:hypothetical protein
MTLDDHQMKIVQGDKVNQDQYDRLKDLRVEIGEMYETFQKSDKKI